MAIANHAMMVGVFQMGNVSLEMVSHKLKNPLNNLDRLATSDKWESTEFVLM